MHDRRYRDAVEAAFAPILDHGSAILEDSDSFAGFFALTSATLPVHRRNLAMQPSASLDRI
jgi:hypothetical protein